MKKLLTLALVAATVLAGCKKDDNPVITITADPIAPVEQTEGNINGVLNVSATVTEGVTLTYQWYEGDPRPIASLPVTLIEGATSASYKLPTDLKEGTYKYFCEIGAKGAEAVRTAVVLVTVAEKQDPVRKNEITINGEKYEVRTLVYYDGFYSFIGEDCIRLHLQFTKGGKTVGAGMTVEMSETLTGSKIDITPSGDAFWFFLVGTGTKNVQFENTYAPAKFGSYGGWFRISRGEETDELTFEWELTNSSVGAITSKGYISGIFEHKTEL